MVGACRRSRGVVAGVRTAGANATNKELEIF